MLRKLINPSKSVLLIIIIFVLANLLTRGPDFLKYIKCPSDKWFTGQASWFDPWDINLYFSAIGWGKRDGFLFENLYDTGHSQRMLLFPLYIILGKTAKFFELSNPLMFHLGGIVLSFILASVVWWLIKLFLNQEVERKTAFVLIFLGGGLGWLFFDQTILPDLGTPGFTLATALRMPREAFSLSLFLLTLGNFWQAIIYQRKNQLILATFFSFLMMLFHPYNLISLGTIFLCFGIYQCLKKDSFNFLKPLFLLVTVGITYYFSIGKQLLSNSGFSGQASQSQSTPTPFQAIAGWGFLFPLIIIAFFSKKESEKTNFLKIWFLSHWLILYLPFSFQKLMIRGLWIPTVLLATKGTKELAQKINLSFPLIAALILILTSIPSFFMTYKRIVETPENRWIYLTKEEGEVIEYLKTHGQDEEGVLASYRIANIIPAHTTKRVYAGHLFQTPNFEERMNQVNKFYSGKMEKLEPEKFLKNINVRWVFWGPDEKAIAGLTEMPFKNLLKPVIEKNGVSLYRIRNY